MYLPIISNNSFDSNDMIHNIVMRDLAKKTAKKIVEKCNHYYDCPIIIDYYYIKYEAVKSVIDKIKTY